MYITSSIGTVISHLHTIIELHKVEHQRKNLLSQLKTVQADLLLKDSPHARDINIFVEHVEEMEKAAQVCIGCHHVEEVQNKLDTLQLDIAQYLKKLSRVYTLRSLTSNDHRLQTEKEDAFELGQQTINKVNSLVITSTQKISDRISNATSSIESTRHLFNFLVFAVPLIVLALVFFFVKQFTGSILTLIKATRKLKEGDLQYRITEDLKDEFYELSTAFNEMASSLKTQCVRMQHAERLAVIGELAAGLAHEVKNPLAGIKVSIEVLSSELPLEQEDKEVFLRIVNEINRIESLLKELLSYARPPHPQPVSLDVHQVLEMPLRNAQFSLKKPRDGEEHDKDIQFLQDFGTGIPKIIADPGQLQQVFLNLFMNAIDAIDSKGTITITTSFQTEGFVHIAISDTGKGMDNDTLNRIFLPFFTTKPKGTGLGLSICKRLIEQHDGTIEAASSPYDGTSFTITLPVLDRQPLENITS